ncbi:MAG: O-antigen ligase family protein [Panacagrimonas sp.]
MDLLIGLVCGCLMTAAFGFLPKLGMLVAVLIAVIPLLILRPNAVFWAALLSILIFEEFPAGLGDVAERANRTAFYSTSVGIPGLYMPDFLLMTAIGLAVLTILIERRPLDLPWDRVGRWLATVTVVMVVSVVMAFVRGNPLESSGPQSVLGTDVEINDRAARLIAFFQFKSFALVMIAYVATLLYVRDRAGLDRCIWMVGLAALIYVAMGTFRLMAHPGWVAQTIPVFFDPMSVLIFILIAFYVIAAWSQGMLSRRQTMWMGILGCFMVLFVLVSFRRTMWGAMALATVPLLVFMPGSKRTYLVVAAAAVFFAIGSLVLLSPAGAVLIDAVSTRLGQTTSEEASTEYRLVLFRHFGEHFFDIPLFGYGPKPLWNDMITQGQFQISLENIHSLYFWLWLRLGHVGLTVFVGGVLMVLAQAWALARRSLDPQYRVLSLMMLLSILMFLFNGLFNPAYGQSRGLVVMGVSLALLSRMIQWNQSGSLQR